MLKNHELNLPSSEKTESRKTFTPQLLPPFPMVPFIFFSDAGKFDFF